MAPGTPDRAVYVIATTPEGTERALHEARLHATAPARITLVVPAVIPEGSTTADTADLMTEYGAIAARCGIRAPYVCVCLHPREVIAEFPIDGSTLIVVGGASEGRSGPSPERALATLLLGEGHDVVFAVVSRAEPTQDPAGGVSSGAESRSTG
jgi:hypothetical protein